MDPPDPGLVWLDGRVVVTRVTVPSVAIFATNSPEYVAAFFGCARIGAALVPINLMFTAEDVAYVFEKTRVKTLLGAKKS